jgi:hypothetical protein
MSLITLVLDYGAKDYIRNVDVDLIFSDNRKEIINLKYLGLMKEITKIDKN